MPTTKKTTTGLWWSAQRSRWCGLASRSRCDRRSRLVLAFQIAMAVIGVLFALALLAPPGVLETLIK